VAGRDGCLAAVTAGGVQVRDRRLRDGQRQDAGPGRGHGGEVLRTIVVLGTGQMVTVVVRVGAVLAIIEGIRGDAGDGDDRRAGPEPVAAHAEIELVRLMQINECDQRMNVFDDLWADQYRPTRNDVELRAQSPVILLDVSKARIVHHRQHAP